MEYRNLGSSGLKVSALSIGTWVTLGDQIGEEAGAACLKAAYEAGVNFFDTAEVYLGSEKAIVPLNDFETGEPLARETLTVGRELGASRDIHYSLHYLGDYALVRGDGTEALGWYAQSMEAALDYGNVAEAALELEALAMALAAGERREAAVRLGAAAAVRMADLGFDTSGVAWWSQLKERFLGAAVAALDEPLARALAAEGRAMGWDAARAEALAAARV